MKPWKLLGALAVALLLVAGVAVAFLMQFRPQLVPLTVAEMDDAAAKTGLADCFWVTVAKPGGLQYAFPDSGAIYWPTQFRIPPGATLELTGEYPHARYLSFNSYDGEGRPVDRLNDQMIAPDAGSTNPFGPGASRDSGQRAYRMRIVAAQLEAGTPVDESQRPANTLFVKEGKEPVQLIMRIYLPDSGQDGKGGVALPKPVLKLADGRVLDGDALCREMVLKEGAARDVRLSPEATKRLLGLSSATSPYHPAQPQAQWYAFFNPPRLVATALMGTSFEWVGSRLGAQRKGGFYSTLDNTYMSMFVDNRFGDVLVLRGRAPTTPKTLDGSPVMQAAQLRYWSLCKYRSFADTGAGDCVFDEQVPVDGEGHYLIAISTSANRPANADAKCGVAWLPWGAGDGLGNPAGGILVLRHMLPAADFTNSVFATKRPGDEATTLGPYYPRGTYMSKAEFEKAGCKSPT